MVCLLLFASNFHISVMWTYERILFMFTGSACERIEHELFDLVERYFECYFLSSVICLSDNYF